LIPGSSILSEETQLSCQVREEHLLLDLVFLLNLVNHDATALPRARFAVTSRTRLEGSVGGMDNKVCGADGDLTRGSVGGCVDEGDVFRQAGEERGEGVGVSATKRLSIEQA
jgi:hypothetical protein